MQLSATPKETKRINSDYYIEGYASTFDRYSLFECMEGTVYEQIDRDAFAGAQMNDVVLLFNHDGDVLARTTNNTLGLEVNDSGLFMYADLKSTSRSRDMFESVRSGLISQMSFAFRVADEEFDETTMTYRIKKIEKVFDVSIVTNPANEFTSVSARDAEEMKRGFNKLKAERAKAKLELLKLEGECLNEHN